MKQSSKVLFFTVFLVIGLCYPKHTFSAAAASAIGGDLEDKRVLSRYVPGWRLKDSKRTAIFIGFARAALSYLEDTTPLDSREFTYEKVLGISNGTHTASSWDAVKEMLSQGFLFHAKPSNEDEHELNAVGVRLRKIFFETCDETFELQKKTLLSMTKEEAIRKAVEICKESKDSKPKYATLFLTIPIDQDPKKRAAIKYMDELSTLISHARHLLEKLEEYLISKDRQKVFTLRRLCESIGLSTEAKEHIPGGALFSVIYIKTVIKDVIKIGNIFKKAGIKAIGTNCDYERFLTLCAPEYSVYPYTAAIRHYKGGNIVPFLASQYISIPTDLVRTGKDSVDAANIGMAILSEGSYSKEFKLDSTMKNRVEWIRKKLNLVQPTTKRDNKAKVGGKKTKKATSIPTEFFPKQGSVEAGLFNLAIQLFKRLIDIQASLINGIKELEGGYGLSVKASALKILKGHDTDQELMLKKEREARHLAIKSREAAILASKRRQELEAQREARRAQEEAEALKWRQALELAKEKDEKLRLKKEEERYFLEERERQRKEAAAIQEAIRQEIIEKEIAEKNRRARTERREERFAAQAELEAKYQDDEEDDSDEDLTETWPFEMPERSEKNLKIAVEFFKKRVTLKTVMAFVNLHTGVRMERNGHVYKVYFDPAPESGAARADDISFYFDMAAFHAPHGGKDWIAIPSMQRLKKKFTCINSTKPYWGIGDEEEDEAVAAAEPSAAAAAAASSAAP